MIVLGRNGRLLAGVVETGERVGVWRKRRPQQQGKDLARARGSQKKIAQQGYGWDE